MRSILTWALLGFMIQVAMVLTVKGCQHRGMPYYPPGVSQIVAGTAVSVTPTTGQGVVTVNSTGAGSVSNVDGSLVCSPTTGAVVCSVGTIQTPQALSANQILNQAQGATNTMGLTIQPNVADGASSIGLEVNTGTTLSTPGSLVMRVRNNAAFMMSLDRSGIMTVQKQVQVAHFVGNSSAPTVAVGAAAQLGTGPSAVITSGTDAMFTATITTGTAPSAFTGGTQITAATVTFNQAYTSAPRGAVVSPAGATAGAIESGTTGIVCYASQASLSTTQLLITCVSSGAGTFAASTAYNYSIAVIQ